MKLFSILTLGLGLAAAPLLADGHASGDAEAGAKVFNKCKACHMIVGDDGTEYVKGNKTGPNLFGLNERQLGSVEGFKYGKSIVELGETGVVWNEAEFVEYVADPRKYLQAKLDNKKARSKMSFKLRKEEEAANVWAFIVSAGAE